MIPDPPFNLSQLRDWLVTVRNFILAIPPKGAVFPIQEIKGSSGTINAATNFVVLTSGSLTVTLPTLTGAENGKTLAIKNRVGSSSTIQRGGTNLIYNAGATTTVTSFTLSSSNQIILIASGTVWYVIN